MSMLMLITTVLALIIYIYYKTIHRIKSIVKNFPSPPSRPVLGHLLDFINHKKDYLYVLNDYLNTCGESLLINMANTRLMILTADPKLLQFILSNPNSFKKSKDYKNVSRWLGTGLITAEGAKWRKNHRIVTGAFHSKILETYVSNFETNAKILVTKLMEETQDKSNVDIFPYVTMCALDMIYETAMGTKVNAQKNTESPYVKSVRTVCSLIVDRAFSPYKMFDLIYFFTSAYRQELKALAIIQQCTEDVIAKRKAERPEVVNNLLKKRKLAFLDLLLSKMIEEHEISEEEIRDEVNTIMFAGHDTTSSAISFALYCLATHPEIQERVVDELKTISRNDFQRDVTYSDLKEMRYLELVIKESLRLYPVVPLVAREVDQDLNFGGTTLPKGLEMVLFFYGVHRNPKYFPDPDKFDPSRYDLLNTNDEDLTYLPFSAGPRQCIGQKFALNQMKTVISRVLKSFELVPAIPAHHLDLSYKISLISKSGMRVGLKLRT